MNKHCDHCPNPVTCIIHGNPELHLCREHFDEWCEKKQDRSYQEASRLFHMAKHETESGKGIERIRKALDEARQQGHAIGYDECLDDHQTEGPTLHEVMADPKLRKEAFLRAAKAADDDQRRMMEEVA